jgi:hypothetical protein
MFRRHERKREQSYRGSDRVNTYARPTDKRANSRAPTRPARALPLERQVVIRAPVVWAQIIDSRWWAINSMEVDEFVCVCVRVRVSAATGCSSDRGQSLGVCVCKSSRAAKLGQRRQAQNVKL